MDPLTHSPSPPAGSPAPAFSLPDLDGRSHSLEHYRGRVVVLNFWSAECPWSERVDGELLAYLQEWGGRVALLPVAANANEAPDLLRRIAAQRGLPRLLHDAERQAARLYGAATTPHLFVMDAEGILRYRGAFDDVTFRRRTPTRLYLREAVEAVLQGRPPQPAETEPYGCTIVWYES